MSNLGNLGVPAPQLPLGSGRDKDGNLINVTVGDVWHKFLVRLSQLSAERPIQAVTPGASPWVYTATTIGFLSVEGGAVSSKVLGRGTINVTTSDTTIPMAAGDTVTVTYTVAPTVVFIPGARA